MAHLARLLVAVVATPHTKHLFLFGSPVDDCLQSAIGLPAVWHRSASGLPSACQQVSARLPACCSVSRKATCTQQIEEGGKKDVRTGVGGRKEEGRKDGRKEGGRKEGRKEEGRKEGRKEGRRKEGGRKDGRKKQGRKDSKKKGKEEGGRLEGRTGGRTPKVSAP